MSFSRITGNIRHFFSSVANACLIPIRKCRSSKVKTIANQYVVLPVTVVGNFLPSMGNTALNLILTTSYVFNQDDDTTSSSTTVRSLIVLFMLFDLTLNVFARMPKYLEQFSQPSKTLPKISKRSAPCFKGCECKNCGINRTSFAAGTYYMTSSLGVLSSVFTGLATYLGTLYLIEYSQKLAGMSEDSLKNRNIETLTTIYIFGVLFGVTKTVGFLLYNHEKIRKRANQVRKKIAGVSDSTYSFHKGALITTLGVTAFNMLGDLGQAYISTGKGLSRLPFYLPPDVINILTFTSLISRTFSYLHTQPFALYDAIEKFSHRKVSLERQLIKDRYRYRLIALQIIGLISSAGIGYANMPGIAKLVHYFSHEEIELQNVWLKIIGGALGLLTATTNYAFNVAEPIEDFISRKQVSSPSLLLQTPTVVIDSSTDDDTSDLTITDITGSPPSVEDSTSRYVRDGAEIPPASIPDDFLEAGLSHEKQAELKAQSPTYTRTRHFSPTTTQFSLFQNKESIGLIEMRKPLLQLR